MTQKIKCFQNNRTFVTVGGSGRGRGQQAVCRGAVHEGRLREGAGQGRACPKLGLPSPQHPQGVQIMDSFWVVPWLEGK